MTTYPSFLPLFGCFLCLWLLTFCQGFISCEQHYSKLRLNQELFTTSKNTESNQKTEQHGVDALIQAKPSKRLAPRELHEKYLPELEIHRQDRKQKLSVNASKWASGIRLGRTKFLAEYATRLQRLGLLTEKSIQYLEQGESPVAFDPVVLVVYSRSKPFEERCEMYLPELEDYFEMHGVLSYTSKEISKGASNWATSIRHGDTMFLAEYASRLERLGILSPKSRQRLRKGETPVVFQPTDIVSHKSFEESCEIYLPELEAYYERHGLLSQYSKEISKEASGWASRIKMGETMFLGEHAARLERLGILSEKSRQLLRDGELPVSFKPADSILFKSFDERCEMLLPELEEYYEKNGSLFGFSTHVSKQARNWAESIKHGAYLFEASYAPRLARLGLLTRKSRQLLRAGEVPFSFTPAALGKNVMRTFDEKCKYHLPMFHAFINSERGQTFFEEFGHRIPVYLDNSHGYDVDESGINEKALLWASSVLGGTLRYDPDSDYISELKELGILGEHSRAVARKKVTRPELQLRFQENFEEYWNILQSSTHEDGTLVYDTLPSIVRTWTSKIQTGESSYHPDPQYANPLKKLGIITKSSRPMVLRLVKRKSPQIVKSVSEL